MKRAGRVGARRFPLSSTRYLSIHTSAALSFRLASTYNVRGQDLLSIEASKSTVSARHNHPPIRSHECGGTPAGPLRDIGTMNLSYDPPPSTIGGPWSHTYDNDLGGDSASAFVGSGSGSESELRRAQSPVEDVRRLWTKQARNNGPGENMNAYARLSAPRPSYRRALSAGALPTLSSAAINFPSHDQLPTPAPSLFSPPLTAVSVDGHAVEASGSAFAAAQERFLNNQPPPQRTQYPPNTSPGSHSFFLPSPTNFPPSPGSHTAHLRQQLLEREEDHPGRRTRSSHLPFVPNASLSGAHTGAGSRHTPRSLSIAVPSPSASASYSASAPFSAPTIPQSSSHYPSNDVQQVGIFEHSCELKVAYSADAAVPRSSSPTSTRCSARRRSRHCRRHIREGRCKDQSRRRPRCRATACGSRTSRGGFWSTQEFSLTRKTWI